MPNLQALGINSQGSTSSNPGQNMSNQSMLNLNSLACYFVSASVLTQDIMTFVSLFIIPM